MTKKYNVPKLEIIVIQDDIVTASDGLQQGTEECGQVEETIH